MGLIFSSCYLFDSLLRYYTALPRRNNLKELISEEKKRIQRLLFKGQTKGWRKYDESNVKTTWKEDEKRASIEKIRPKGGRKATLVANKHNFE